MPSVFIRTWGCTLNQSDSDIMRGILERQGYSFAQSERGADVIVLNTCTVKGATENKILAHLKRLRQEGKKIVAAGCLSVNAEKIRKIAPNAPLVGPGAVESIGEAVRMALRGEKGGFTAIKRKFRLPRKLGSPIARIPIAEGCVGRCAFCQTRLARPVLMSYPPKEVVLLVEEAVAKGAREIQLAAMDTGAYGIDIGGNLVSLLREIVKVKGNFKVRLGMINPGHARRMENELAGIFKNRKMFKFLHIPVQSGSEKVCREMERAHTVSDFEDAARKFRKEIPGMTIATDIIVAYPTETEEDYGKTIGLLERVKPDIVNLSRFTPRPGTGAKKLRQADARVAKKRTSEAHALIREIAERNAQEFAGREMGVLVNERGAAGQMKGRAGNYRQVVVSGGSGLMGREIRVRITGASHSSLFGEILE